MTHNTFISTVACKNIAQLKAARWPREHRSQCDDKNDVETADCSGGGRPAGRQQGSGLKTTPELPCDRSNRMPAP